MCDPGQQNRILGSFISRKKHSDLPDSLWCDRVPKPPDDMIFSPRRAYAAVGQMPENANKKRSNRKPPDRALLQVTDCVGGTSPHTSSVQNRILQSTICGKSHPDRDLEENIFYGPAKEIL